VGNTTVDGEYVTRDRKTCQLDQIDKDVLETSVIEAVQGFYRPYLVKDGRRKLATVVKEQLGSEGSEVEVARQRAQEEQERIGGIINNLLDNITNENREFVDQRLKELSQQRQQLETRLDQLDRLDVSRAEIKVIVDDAMRFITGLEYTFSQGVPQEKLVALRQCIDRILINKPQNKITLNIHQIPTGNVRATCELEVSLVQPHLDSKIATKDNR